MSAVPLSVIVPTRNAARWIGECLASAGPLGEMIVVDAESEDDTVRIAESHGARVVGSRERSPARQRNEGIAVARGEWILCVDADERVPADLHAEIRARVADPGPYLGFFIPRNTWYLGRRIRYSGWQSDRVLRLFRRGSGTWRDETLHERVALDGKAGALSNALEHRSYETLDDVLEKLERYTTWGAQELARQGRRVGIWEVVVHPPVRFLKTYVLKAGFLDGAHGAAIAAFSAYYVLLRYAKAWEMRLDARSAARPGSIA